LTGEPEQFFESRFPCETFNLFTHLPLASLTSEVAKAQRPMKELHVVGADVKTLVPTFLPNRMRRLTIFQILQPEAPARPEIAHGTNTLPDWDHTKSPGTKLRHKANGRAEASFCHAVSAEFVRRLSSQLHD
jgi:hypothetical protein